MQILITGGCGFIGSNIAAYHLKMGDSVSVIDNLSTGKASNIGDISANSRYNLIETDIMTYEKLVQEVEKADRIYHFSAVVGVLNVLSKPVSVLETNIFTTERLLKVVSESQRKPLTIIASSSSVYGYSPNKVLRETDQLFLSPPTNIYSAYAISKLACESLTLTYFKQTEIPIIIVRPFNTVGLNQTGRYGMVVPRFVRQAAQGKPLSIYGDGTQTRSFCNVKDIVVALDLLAKNPRSIGEIINIGNDHEITINELAELVCKCAGRELNVEYVPYEEVYGSGWKEVSQRRPGLDKLFKLTGFKAKWSIEDTVKELLEVQLL